MTSEVGSAQVPVFPTFKGFRKAVVGEVDGAVDDGSNRFKRGFSRTGESTGASVGQGFKKAFTSASAGAAKAAVADISKDVASASKSLSAARLKEQDAAGKVRVAEAQLAEARSKNVAGSARVIAAEEKLATTQRNLGAIQGVVKSSTDSLTSAQSRLALATAAAEQAATRSGGGFTSFFRAAGPGLRGLASGVDGVANGLLRGVGGALSFVADKFATVAKVGTGAIVGLGAVVAGLGIKGGLDRLLNIEDAQAKLKGLGNSTETVAAIMDNALSAVRGTFFKLDDAATVAASAVAANVKPGEQLAKYLRLVADTATIAGRPLNEIGSILNKVSASQKAYNDTLGQLQDSGIPVYQYLAKELGVTTDAIFDMATQGEISSEQLQTALEKNIGGAALSAGDTTRGAFANMVTAISRAGAKLLGPILPKFQSFFTQVGGFFDTLGGQAELAGTNLATPIQKILDGALKVLDVIGGIAKSDEGFTFDNVRTQFENAFPGMDNLFQILDALRPVLPEVAEAFKKIAPDLAKVIPPLSDLAVELLPLLVEIIPILVEAIKVLAPILKDTAENLTAFARGWKEVVGAFAGDGDLESRLTTLVGGLRSLPGPFGDVLRAASDFGSGLGTALIHGAEQILQFGTSLGESFQHGKEQIQDFERGIISFFTDLGASFANGGVQIGSFFTDIGASFANGAQQLRDFANDVGTNIGKAVEFVGGLPGRAVTAIGDLGRTLYGSGKALIDGFLDGIKKAAEKVGDVVGAVIKNVAGFFPNSPAKHGPLSGAGWTKLGRSGGAILDQATKGLDVGPDGLARVAGVVTALAGPSSASGYSSSSASPAAAAGSGNVYIDKIVAPDQNPVVSGRIMGREFLRVKAG